MVLANGGNMTILKARFGNDVRKTSIHHGNDLTLNDLVLMLQRIYSIKNADSITLKYKDSEGDLVTLADDSDLLLALQEPSFSVEVLLDGAFEQVSDVQQQLAKIQNDVQRLAVALSTISVSQGSAVREHQHNLAPLCQQPSLNGLDNSFNQVPPSPVPSDKPEPATIQPSSQEQVVHDGLSHREVSAPLEEEIPLEAGAPHHHEHEHQPHQQQQQSDYPSVPDPHMQSFGAPAAPVASIPSFPQSNMPPPQQQQEHPHPQFVQHPPTSFAPPPVPQSHTPHSSVSSTPIPQQSQHTFAPPTHQHQPQQPQGFAPPPQQQQQGFAPPPQMGGPPNPGFAPPTSQMSGAPPPQQQMQHPGFAPPPSMGGAPPQQHQQPPQQFGGPQGFAPPTSGFGGPQQFGAPPSEPAPPGGMPPQQQQQQPQFSSPPQMGGHPMGGPGFAPPSMGAPPLGGPPPMGGAPGGNPFARPPSGHAYRQSPYHQ